MTTNAMRPEIASLRRARTVIERREARAMEEPDVAHDDALLAFLCDVFGDVTDACALANAVAGECGKPPNHASIGNRTTDEERARAMERARVGDERDVDHEWIAYDDGLSAHVEGAREGWEDDGKANANGRRSSTLGGVGDGGFARARRARRKTSDGERSRNEEAKGVSIITSDGTQYGLERLSQLLLLPCHEAAAKLGISLTTFKLRCRELGVRKWPHRRLRSIEELYTYVADVFQKVVLVSISSKPKIEKSLAQLDNDVRGLMRDLEALRAHAEDLEMTFIRQGSTEYCEEPSEVAKIRGRVYRHRAAVSTYAQNVKPPVVDCLAPKQCANLERELQTCSS